MSHKKKSFFPKVSTKLSHFLTDESWKITKKDALGLASWAILFASISEAHAGHSSSTSHSSSVGWNRPWGNGHASGNWWSCTSTLNYSQHASWVVNWHFSSNVSWSWSGASCVWWTAGHWNVSHGSHGSHSNTTWEDG